MSYQLEQYGKVRLPLRWCAVVQELDSRRLQKQKTISYSEFETLCRTKHGTAAPAAVLQYLHRSGQVFYRSGAFDNQIVLDLDWALDGIYAVLDRNRALPVIRRQAGRFTSQLLAALVWQKYSAVDHNVFLSLMQQCRICFKVADNAYVAPALLPSEAEMHADLEKVWRGARPEAAARLQYSFLHEGVLRAMLCGLGNKAGESAVYWAYGICFHDLETKSTALIRSEFSDRTGYQFGGHITVEAAGAGASLLAQRLVESIQQVNIGRAPEVIWTAGGPEMKKVGEANAEKPLEPFSAVKPGQAPTRPGESRPVYVSYAWGGESEALVDEIEARLPADCRLVRDKRELRPGDWIPKFMQEIGRADCVLVVLSEKYLRSIYCMRELLYLYQSSLSVRETFLDRVVPLTVGDVRASRAADRLEYVHFWESEDKKLDAAIAKIDRLGVGDADRDEQLAIKDFAHRVSDMMSWVVGTLMPRGPDLQTKGIDAAIDLIQLRVQRPALESYAYRSGTD